MALFHINKKLLPVKMNYFLINAGHAGVVPFIAVYAKQMGIGADIMGYIFAILSCITVISKPLIGGFVDHFQKLKLVVVTLILIDILAAMGLNFIPSTSKETLNYTNSSICLQNSSYVVIYDGNACSLSSCLDECVTSCTLCDSNSEICMKSEPINDNATWNLFHIPPNCTDAILEKCNRKNPCDEKCIGGSIDCDNKPKANSTIQLWLLSIFTTLIYICIGSIVSLSDAACFNALGDNPGLYGKQRMWGTIGWGTFALLAGYLNQVLTGASKTYSYSAGFYLMAVLLVIDLTVLPKMELKVVKKSRNIFRDVGLSIVKPRILLFIIQVFLIGVFVGMSRSYLFWYLRTLNGSQLVLGMTSVVQCFFGELPFFFFAGWIIGKIGHAHTFTMSFVAHGIKFLSYSYLVDPWWVLPIEILQGPCFGSFYSAMASYSKLIAPTGTEATVQGIASATFEGLGLATGSLLGGYGFKVFDGQTTFFWAGIISSIFSIVNCIANAMMRHQ